MTAPATLGACGQFGGGRGDEHTSFSWDPWRIDMRKLVLAAAVAALFALPNYAQQRDDSAAKPATDSSATEAPAAAVTTAPATRGIFLVPAIPRNTPFPGPQAA